MSGDHLDDPLRRYAEGWLQRHHPDIDRRSRGTLRDDEWPEFVKNSNFDGRIKRYVSGWMRGQRPEERLHIDDLASEAIVCVFEVLAIAPTLPEADVFEMLRMWLDNGRHLKRRSVVTVTGEVLGIDGMERSALETAEHHVANQEFRGGDYEFKHGGPFHGTFELLQKNKLPWRHYLGVVQRGYHGSSYSEIAKVIEVSSALAARQAVSRGRKTIPRPEMSRIVTPRRPNMSVNPRPYEIFPAQGFYRENGRLLFRNIPSISELMAEDIADCQLTAIGTCLSRGSARDAFAGRSCWYLHDLQREERSVKKGSDRLSISWIQQRAYERHAHFFKQARLADENVNWLSAILPNRRRTESVRPRKIRTWVKKWERGPALLPHTRSSPRYLVRDVKGNSALPSVGIRSPFEIPYSVSVWMNGSVRYTLAKISDHPVTNVQKPFLYKLTA